MVVDSPAESEVGDLEFSIMEQDVLRFYVSVDDVAIVENLVSGTKIFKEAPDQFFRAVAALFDVLLECSPIAVLHDQVEVVLARDPHFYTVH